MLTLRTGIRLCLVASTTCAALLIADARAQEAKPQPPRRLYLDEFRPRSQLRVPQHRLTRAKFPCVNVHFHPEKLSAAELDEHVQVMDDANIAVSVSLDGRIGTKFGEHLASLTARHPKRFVAFVRMDYVGEGKLDDPKTWDLHKPGFGARMADHLSEAVRQGASGLKLLKSLGLTLRNLEGKLIAPDDPRFDPIWERAGELKIPVIWHCADPRAFFDPIDERNERWEELYRHPEWSFHGGDFPKFDDLVAARMRVVAKHPKTTFILAHFADLPDDLKTLGGYLDNYPNAYVEFAGRIAELGRQPTTAREFFLKYQDRILFGTDGVPPTTELVPHFQMLETRDEYFPYEDNPFPPQGFWNIYGLDLPDDVLRQVYFENAIRIIPGVREAVEAYAASKDPALAKSIAAGIRGPARWESAMKRFDQENAAGEAKPGGVLFVGSSSIVRWKLEESFPGKGYINRGFGGSQASEDVPSHPRTSETQGRCLLRRGQRHRPREVPRTGGGRLPPVCRLHPPGASGNPRHPPLGEVQPLPGEIDAPAQGGQCPDRSLLPRGPPVPLCRRRDSAAGSRRPARTEILRQGHASPQR